MNKLKSLPVLLLISATILILILGGYLYLKEPTLLIDFFHLNDSSVVKIEIPKNSWTFSPEEIRLKKDRKYTIQITNRDDYPHGFAVTELNVNQYIPPSTVKSFEIIPKISGTFTSYCSVVCGQGHFKMKGKVIVTE